MNLKVSWGKDLIFILILIYNGSNAYCFDNLQNQKNTFFPELHDSRLKFYTVIQDSVPLKNFDNEEYTVLLVFGQSNSSNYGQTKYECREKVYNWYNGKIFRAKDPLKGADGTRGSVWGRLGDKLISSMLAKKVLLVPLGIGSTTVSDWSEDGPHYERIINTIQQLNGQDIKIDYIFWHQGESDNFENTTTEDYTENFESIRLGFRKNDVVAPIFIAIASYHPNVNSLKYKKFGCDPAIQRAQYSLIMKYPDLFIGANTDNLIKSYYRHDGVHFSVLGLEKHAELWLQILKNFRSINEE